MDLHEQLIKLGDMMGEGMHHDDKTLVMCRFYSGNEEI